MLDFNDFLMISMKAIWVFYHFQNFYIQEGQYVSFFFNLIKTIMTIGFDVRIRQP